MNKDEEEDKGIPEVDAGIVEHKRDPNKESETVIGDIWCVERIRLKILNYLDTTSLLEARVACRGMNNVISVSPNLLDNVRYRIDNEAMLTLFIRSDVLWRLLRISYWPLRHNLNQAGDTFLFWEEKGVHMKDVFICFPEGEPMSNKMLFSILAIPKKLQRLALHCNLAGLGCWSIHQQNQLGKSLAHVIHIALGGFSEIKIQSLFEFQVFNLLMLLCFVPDNQLVSINIRDGFQMCEWFNQSLGGFTAAIVSRHASTLRILRFKQLGLTPEKLNEICSHEALKLECLDLDFAYTCREFEKSAVEHANPSLATSLTKQVQAWRSFFKLMKRSNRLKEIDMFLYHYNEKNGKKIFPKSTHTSLQKVCISAYEIGNEDAMRGLTKLKNLRDLHLEHHITREVDQRPVVIKDATKSFFASLSTCLANLILVGFDELSPTCVIVLSQRLSNLEVLKLNSCDGMVTDAAVQSIFQYLRKLKILQLVSSPRVTDAGLCGRYSLKSLTDLEQFHLTHSKITNQSLRKALPPRLQVLGLSFSKKITERGILDMVTAAQFRLYLRVEGVVISKGMMRKIFANCADVIGYGANGEKYELQSDNTSPSAQTMWNSTACLKSHLRGHATNLDQRGSTQLIATSISHYSETLSQCLSILQVGCEGQDAERENEPISQIPTGLLLHQPNLTSPF